MRTEVAKFLLAVCESANIPGSMAELMVEAKQSLKAIEAGNGPNPLTRGSGKEAIRSISDSTG